MAATSSRTTGPEPPPPPITTVPDGALLDLPHRRPSWGRIFVVPDHPLAPPRQYCGNGKIFKDKAIPLGSDEEVEAEGHKIIATGDCVFARNSRGTGLAEEDRFLVWKFNIRLIDPIYCDVYLKVIQDILGERSECTLDGAHMMHDGSWYGGTAFEQRKTNVPTAAAKREGLELDENQKMRQKLAKAWLPICTKVAEILTAANFEYRKLFNQLFNEPCLGHPTNYMHVSMQANFAVLEV
ncbi:hypothetical protein M422DRAFT_274251 [Sphaerobolus stellatus SS14]|uniref:Uncharacterized protein n=1 Tax=Sphaerobolus stellatus (strain SS14) TaxID=990650 RepID=A0A0C9TSN7_SPHS4|nr:hypothetical protein M422DRAFT_274251 [Sphaerobolus stellatus SS14]